MLKYCHQYFSIRHMNSAYVRQNACQKTLPLLKSTSPSLQITAYREMMNDELDKELQDSAQQEVAALSTRLGAVERDLLVALIPEEPADERNVILEVRAGAGGTEASLFAGELFEMYRQYSGTLLHIHFQAPVSANSEPWQLSHDCRLSILLLCLFEARIPVHNSNTFQLIAARMLLLSGQ
jgi:protein subunit release factor A